MVVKNTNIFTEFFTLNRSKQSISMVKMNNRIKKTDYKLHFLIAFSFPVTLRCFQGRREFVSGNGLNVVLIRAINADRHRCRRLKHHVSLQCMGLRTQDLERPMAPTNTQLVNADEDEQISLGAVRLQQFRSKKRAAGVKRVDVYANPALVDVAEQVATSAMAMRRHSANSKPGVGVGVRCLSEIAASLWPALAPQIEADGDWTDTLSTLVSAVVDHRRALISETGMPPADVDRLLILAMERERVMARAVVPAGQPLPPSSTDTQPLGTEQAPSSKE